MDETQKAIRGQIEKYKGDLSAYSDYFDYCRDIEDHKENKWLRGELEIKNKTVKDVDLIFFWQLYRKTLLFDAPVDVDAYMQYLELGRNAEDRFWLPRRNILYPVAEKLQKLADNELDELFLSCPPRVGKTTLMIYYLTWLMGRDTEHPNLYSSYTSIITRAFFDGVLEIMTDKDTYLWNDIFDKSIVSTDSKNTTIDLERNKHYPTLTCRSIDGTINGACDAERGIIIGDDLCSGIEEALSPERMRGKWNKVDNDLIPRGKGGTKYLWVGTRWSVADPIGLRLDLLEHDPKYKSKRYAVITLPALNEKDESNFEYAYGVGFNTEYYQQRRASFERNNDMASWESQYMCEPIEREGTLFAPDMFRYFTGDLVEKEPDRKFMAIDPAFGGGDFTASPICYQYGDEVYVVDVVYNDGDKEQTQPEIVRKIEKWGIQAVQIEGTKATEGYKDGIEQKLKEKQIKVNLTLKPAPTNVAKETRIFDKAPDLRENYIFLESEKRSKEYTLFMVNVFGFKMLGKNKHDDAPDSLAMAVEMQTRGKRKVTPISRLY